MTDLEFPSPFEPSEEINEDKSFGIISDQNGVSGRERSLNSFASSNGDINALKFAARDIRLSLASSERNTDDVINYLSKEIGEKGVESHLNQEQLQDALKDLQLENSINYNFNNGAKDEAGVLSASTSNTSLSSELSEASNSASSIVFPPISTPLPPPLSAADIPEHSPFEMMSPFEPSELPEPPQLPKKLSFSDAPYSLDDFIDSSPFEPTKYIAPLSLSSPRNITNGPQSDGRTELFSSSNSAANISTIGQPLSAPSSSQSMSIPNNNINNFANVQPSSSPPISVVSVGSGGPRKFTLLKEFAPLSSSPPISFKQNPKSAPNSPRNEISASPEPAVTKPSGRSNSLNSTYGSTSISSSGSVPKRESGGNLSPVHEYREELMETIVVDQNRKSGWVTHRPAAKDNYTLGSHRKSTAVGATTVAQLNADANNHNRMTVKFSEPLRESNDKNRWQSVEKHENPKIGQENVRKQRKSLLTRSTSASSLPRNSVSREEGPISNNTNIGDKNQRKNSKTEPTSPLQMTKSESAIMKSDPVNSGGITAALSEAGLIGTITESNNNNTNEPEEKKPRRKSLIGKLTRTLSSTFKPLINSVKDNMKEKSDPSSTSPASSSPSSLSSSPTSSSIKISSPPANEKRKKRSASDARNKKPILPVSNDRDRSQTVVAFTDMQRNGAYSANGIFGIPLDILYQQNDGVPDLINVCCGYLEQKALNLEGLFRISPTMTEVNQWKTDLTFESMHKLNDVDNPHVVASLLKQFFFDLPDPLFTDLLFKQFQDATDIENDTLRKIKLEELLKKLPEANFMVLQALVTFLRKVAKNSHENKMDARNLALVLSPSILRRKSAMFDVADLTKAKQHWMIIYDLIVNYDLMRDTPPKDYLPVD